MHQLLLCWNYKSSGLIILDDVDIFGSEADADGNSN